jgi:phospholipase/lecithinase/hemolysin
MATPLDFSTLAFFGDSLTDNGNLPEDLQPDPPYVDGKFTNGFVHAEILPGELGVAALNFAIGGAQASTDPADPPLQAQINLSAQVDRFLAQGVPPDTAAALFIGIDDYLFTRPANESEALVLVGRVLASIHQATVDLTEAGVERVIFYTLPDPSITPLGRSLPESEREALDAIVAAHNTGLKFLAGFHALSGTAVSLVDINRLGDEVVADQETFGLKEIAIPLYVPGIDDGVVPTGVGALYGEDAVAFFDSIHPTAAVHGIVAAFEEATLRADFVHQRRSANDKILGLFGDEFILTGAGHDRVEARSGDDVVGDDVVLAGRGNDTVSGGAGNDLLILGSGADEASGGSGTDLLAGNAGSDHLRGGSADDVLIGGRGGDRCLGGAGNDLFLFTAGEGGARADRVAGGDGIDTLRLSMTDSAFRSEAFQQELSALEAELPASSDAFTFTTLNLTVSGVERIEVVVAGETVAAAGAALPEMSAAMRALLRDAELWNLI